MKLLYIALTATGLAAGPAVAQQDFSKVEIETSDLGGGIYMMEGAGGNLGVSVGEDGVFLIDDQFAPLSGKILAAIAKISDKPVTFVVNTHYHGDHTGGNEALGAQGAVIVAHDNVRVRMSAESVSKIFGRTLPASPEGALPVITFSESTTFHFNGETAKVIHLEAAHTDGDSIIRFTRANVIHAGDIFFNGMYPFIDVEAGGSLAGTIAALDTVAAAADADTKIIPGHGALASKADVIAERDMLETVRGRIQPLIDAGKTLEEVVAADPLADLNALYGQGFIDGKRFAAIAFYSLSGTLPE